MSVLSSTDIIKELKNDNICITPFIETNLSSSSYDITLGEFYFRPSDTLDYLNPWDNSNISKYWGNVNKAIESKGEYNLKHGERYIVLKPNETILCHSNEFIGGKNFITTMIKAKSTMGRSEIEICSDAGWGDIGYINRWTLEIRSRSKIPIILIVGKPIGQIVFFYSTIPIIPYGKDCSEVKSKYQTKTDLQTIIKEWSPLNLLPK